MLETKISKRELGILYSGIFLGFIFGVLGDFWVSYYMEWLQSWGGLSIYAFILLTIALAAIGIVWLRMSLRLIKTPEEPEVLKELRQIRKQNEEILSLLRKQIHKNKG